MENKTFKQFSEKGYKHFTENTIEELDELSLKTSDIITEFAHLCEWLRVTHGIWIFTDYGKKTKNWYYNIQFLPTQTTHIERILWQDGFDIPQEAYSAAFDYTLKELI